MPVGHGGREKKGELGGMWKESQHMRHSLQSLWMKRHLMFRALFRAESGDLLGFRCAKSRMVFGKVRQASGCQEFTLATKTTCTNYRHSRASWARDVEVLGGGGGKGSS